MGRSFSVTLKNFDFLLKTASKHNSTYAPSIGKTSAHFGITSNLQKPFLADQLKYEFEPVDAETLFS
jgi:hypothetical protein